jgi:peptide deformylase
MQLVKSPDPWLDKAVPAFDFETLDAKQIEKEMIELMIAEGGIGLSANQVALDAQIFVIKPYLLENKEPFAVINPVILRVTEDTDASPEGCLSHPLLFLNVKRPRGLVAKYLDTDAKECTIELYDIDARCFLHEYDHLQGIEFVDRVSKLKLDLARKKQIKIEKRIAQHG